MNIIRFVLDETELRVRFGPTCTECGSRWTDTLDVNGTADRVAREASCTVCGATIQIEACDAVAVYEDDAASATESADGDQLFWSPPNSPSLSWKRPACPTVASGEAGARTGLRTSTDASIRKNQTGKGSGWRAGHLAPMRQCPEFTRADTDERTYKTQKRINGTIPRLVEMDLHRQKLVGSILDKHGKAIGTSDSGAEATAAEFQVLLIEAGYSEGSTNEKTMKNRKDGCVYKYPAYMMEFFDEKVFSKRSDFFEPWAEAKAQEFAQSYGAKKAASGKSEEVRTRLGTKHAKNVMHGFSDYVRLATASARTCGREREKC